MAEAASIELTETLPQPRIAEVRQAHVPFAFAPSTTTATVRQFALTRFYAGRLLVRPAIRARSELWHVLRGLFSHGWYGLAPAMLQVSVRTVGRLCVGDRQPTLDQLHRLERWARRMPGMLEQWRVEAHAVVDAEAERRGLEIAGAVTRLRAMVVAREAADKAKEAARAARVVQKRAEAEARRSRAGGRGDADPLRLREGRRVLGTRRRGRPKKV